MCKIIGIDISKQTFDLSFKRKDKWVHKVLKNNKQGFKTLVQFLEEDDWVVMEASGSYYLQLASYVHSKGFNVSVVNPLVIKRYSQARLNRAKTDKKDAGVIAEYGNQFDLKLWKPESDASLHLKQINTALELIEKQIQQTCNQLEAFTSSGFMNKDLKKELNKLLKSLKARKLVLEKKMKQIAQQNYRSIIDRLKTIPGIGEKTAIMLVVITDGFKKFNNYKQLIAYVGFSPRIYQSGTSVKGKAHICKMGKAQIRKLLYMCSWSAKKANKMCVELYERLKGKGKPERVIKVAIANKLLKQAFAIAKNQTEFNPNYLSKKLVY